MQAFLWPWSPETLSESYRAQSAYALGFWRMNPIGLYGPYRVSQVHSGVGGECHPHPDDCLVVTISVQFEIPLSAGISTAEPAEYLPDSDALANASASPEWGYMGSDGDNAWFLGIKNDLDWRARR